MVTLLMRTCSSSRLQFMNYRPILGLLFIAGLARASAQSFQYQATNNPTDVLIAFRQQGASSELLVNAGPTSKFAAAKPGSSFAITSFTHDQLTRAFPTLDSIQFSAFATTLVQNDPNQPNSTIWATRARLNPDLQSTPWVLNPQGSLSSTAVAIASIGVGAEIFSQQQPPSPDNTASAIALPPTLENGLSHYFVGGDFSSFQGNIELLAPDDFSSLNVPARADFYEVRPGPKKPATPATYLGYFELQPTGTLSFFAAGGTNTPPPAAPAPVIQSIVRNGTTNTVLFTTVSGAHQYSLLRSGAAGLTTNTVTWTKLGVSAPGTGSPVSLSDVSDVPSAFYRVQVDP
jgi:hypothetical protein